MARSSHVLALDAVEECTDKISGSSGQDEQRRGGLRSYPHLGKKIDRHLLRATIDARDASSRNSNGKVLQNSLPSPLVFFANFS